MFLGIEVCIFCFSGTFGGGGLSGNHAGSGFGLFAAAGLAADCQSPFLYSTNLLLCDCAFNFFVLFACGQYPYPQYTILEDGSECLLGNAL